MKVGDRVVCIKEGCWVDSKTGIPNIYSKPSYLEEVVVDRLRHGDDGRLYLYFAEYTGGYNSIQFRPIDFTFGEEVAESIEEEINEEELVRI